MLVVPSTAKAHDYTGAGPKIVMYVEVNDNDINNVGKYTLVGQNAVVEFASRIITENYGVHVMYNLSKTNSSYISTVTQNLYELRTYL